MSKLLKFVAAVKELLASDPEKLKKFEELEVPAEEKPGDQPPAPDDNSSVEEAISKLPAEVVSVIREAFSDVKKLTGTVGELKARDDERTKAVSDAEAARKKQLIADAVKRAVDDFRIGPKDEAGKKVWETLLTADYETSLKAIEALPQIGKPGQKNSTQNESGSGLPPAQPQSRAAMISAAASAFNNE